MTRELRARLTLIALVAFAAVSTDLYLSGIPGLIRDLGATHAQGQATIGVFVLGLAFGQLLFGPLSDYYGRRPVVLAGVWLYVVASVLCALSPRIEWLIALRAVQGFVAAAGPVIARAMVRDRYQGQDAARMMALLAAAMSVVPQVAPVIGSWLLYAFDWRAQFGALVVFGLVVLHGLRSVDETCATIASGRLNLLGVFVQMRRCLATPAFMAFAIGGSAAFGAMFAWISSASYIMTEVCGIAPQHFGYTFMAVAAGFMGGSLLSSRLVARLRPERVLVVGIGCALLAACVLVGLALAGVRSAGWLLAAVALCFFGNGLSLPNAQICAISLFPASAGGASAVFGCMQMAVGSLAGFVVGRAYDGSPLPTALTMLAATLVATLAGAWIARR